MLSQFFVATAAAAVSFVLLLLHVLRFSWKFAYKLRLARRKPLVFGGRWRAICTMFTHGGRTGTYGPTCVWG